MKQKIFLILMAIGLTTLGWTQQGQRHPNNPRPQGEPRFETEALSITGRLIVANGFPAIKNGDITYIVKGINRLTGFVDGLKEGAQVTIEGSSIKTKRDDNISVIIPSKLTLNGKEYDMAPLAVSPNFRNNRWNRGPDRAQPYQKHPYHHPNAPRRQQWL